MSARDTLGGIPERVTALKARYADRDVRNAEVQAVRRNKLEQIAPDMFSEDWKKPIVANLIKVAAEDAAAVLAPLPAFNCSASSGLSERAKAFADRRTKIVRSYLKVSKFQLQMTKIGADQYNTYGLLVIGVEPDFDINGPRLNVESAIGAYPVWNKRGEVVEFVRVYHKDWYSLIADYPALEGVRKNHADGILPGHKVEVVKYVNKNRCLVYLPHMGNHVLEDFDHGLDFCPYVVAQRPALDEDEIAGAYDDAIWVQAARNRIQMLLMEGVEKSVRAPLVVTPDVTDLALGPDSIITAQGGAGSIGRARLDMPSQAFGAVEQLKQEVQTGAMSPEFRSGNIDASVITGRGIQQLSGGFNAQISKAQEVFKAAFEDVIRMALMIDEKVFGSYTKDLRGNDNGVPYAMKYKPAKDIDGDYTVDITYGFAAGLDPNRALVFLLQADGAGLVSKDYIRRNLPVDINAAEEATKIEVEQSRMALIQAFSALAQSIPQLAAAGQDPSDAVMKQAKLIKALQDGKTVEDAVLKAFAPEAPSTPPGASSPGESAPPGPGDGSAPGGFTSQGLPAGLAAGAATEGQGGRPDLAMMFAGLSSSGQPNLQAGVSRMKPAGT